MILSQVRAGEFDPSIVPYMATRSVRQDEALFLSTNSSRLGVTQDEVLRQCGEEAGFLGLAGTPDSK